MFADVSGIVDSPLGGTLQLSCSYQGIPPPNNVTWRHNDTDLLPSDPDITIEFDDTSTTLTRTNLPANGGGSYVCIATNVVGAGTVTARVRVQCESHDHGSHGNNVEWVLCWDMINDVLTNRKCCVCVRMCGFLAALCWLACCTGVPVSPPLSPPPPFLFLLPP